MKKFISLIILLSVICCSGVAHSQSVEEDDPGFVILDVLLYRPLGFAATVVGAGVFVGLSPLTAFASIPEPHDAFAKSSKILIGAPAAYTFIRPIGDREFPYSSPPYKYRPATTSHKVDPSSKNSVIQPQPRTPADPVVPEIQPYQQQGL
jgi:hypothetical protein